MKVFEKIKDLQHLLNESRSKNVAIGFVPTMGALHKGHISLIKAARQSCDLVVCSIFVNPTQFNDVGDLSKYPRTIEKDKRMLIEEETDILFLPSVEEIYPKDIDTTNPYDFGKMAEIMEGAHRPGHFDGMAQVVARLLRIVEPHKIFMGQKDFQQQAIVRKMMELMKIDTELIRCPIIREPDGLAMSSRNVHLSPENRKLATIISQTLFEAKENAKTMTLKKVKALALEKLNHPDCSVDYFEIVDAYTITPISDFEDTSSAVICTTVQIGGIRLLDNIILFE